MLLNKSEHEAKNVRGKLIWCILQPSSVVAISCACLCRSNEANLFSHSNGGQEVLPSLI